MLRKSENELEIEETEKLLEEIMAELRLSDPVDFADIVARHTQEPDGSGNFRNN